MKPLVAVAVSGGRDSMALLHCTANAAREPGIEVLALHVHHGLQPDADAWAAQVEGSCKRWGLRFAMRRLAGKPGRGESIEAWARRERYLALTEMACAAGAGLVLLAHHRDDQGETFLLQALRGAGPAGLAAMPRRADRRGLVWARPWLDIPHAAIAAYARRHRLRWVDDPSNADPRHDRSRLRSQVMPALREAFPHADALLAASARRCAEAQAVLAEVAADDLGSVCTATRALRIAAWRTLSEARRRNVLRAWLHQRSGRGAPQSLIDRLMDELPDTGPAQWAVEGLILRRYRGQLEAIAALAPERAPTRGILNANPVEQGGVSVALLSQAQWRERSGGERFQRAVGTPPRSLKKQFQDAGVPAWQRDAPLLFSSDGRLLYVPGLGIDARALAAPGEAQCALSWEPSR